MKIIKFKVIKGKPRALLYSTMAVLLVVGSVALIGRHAAAAVSIWSDSDTPAVLSDSDSSGVELGAKFRSSVATTVTGVRFYKSSANTGTHTGTLWSSGGTQLATVTFQNETASGWQTASFAAPVSISADTTYVISYHAPNGHYSVDEGYFANKSASNGTLTALQNGTDGGNGVYKYGSTSTFPTDTYNSSNYWVDVTTAASDSTAPTVSVTAPAASSTVSGTATVTADAADNVAVANVQFQVDGANIGSADTTSPYSASWNTGSVSNGSHALTAIATDSAGNRTTSSTVSVTVSNQAPSTAASIWPNSTVPSVADHNDTGAVELGLKFRSTSAVKIAGVKFYKGSGNTGMHTGSLWDASGNRLAQVTFQNETATGWQEAQFATPVDITANTTYVVSYYAPAGHYAADGAMFANAGVTNVNLTALQNGTDGGNGVYKYGAASAFPTDSWNATNYWVDVISTPLDNTAPTVTAVTPANNATGVATDSTLTATFSEALTASTVSGTSVILKDAQNNAVASSVSYDSASNKVSVTPIAALEQGTQYTATLTTAIKDAAGNALANNYSWSFTTQATTVGSIDPLAQGHDGPILVITKSGQPFNGYYAEILRAEGLSSFKTVDIGAVNGTLLASYDVAILGDMSLTDSQVTSLTAWVNAGGNLIAMHPDKKLAGLLGLTDQSALLSDAYLKVDTSKAPGAGITGETIQYHGVADKYAANSGTSTVAALYSNDTTATTNPAVTLRNVGNNGGQAAAFTYDLARSVVQTHQGNPSWAGDDRDGNGVIRPNDLFYGNKTGDSQPDYVNLNKVAIPQADEQQRLLANIIGEVNKDKRPLPKLSYFPYNKKAVVTMVADDHATSNGTVSALDYQLSQSPSGCSVADWECVRSTSLIYTDTPVTDAQASTYHSQGFDFGVHTSTGCANWTPASLNTAIDSDISAFKAKYTSLPDQHVNRIHCIAWSTYDDAAKLEAQKGLRLDLNYYYWPGSWVQDRPGFMTGSGMDMRFAGADGKLIDTYQLPSHLVNESGQTWPQNINTMLDRALGTEGYYGVLGTHYDYSDQFDRQLVQAAKAHNVPLVSGQQLLDWNDGRNDSYFSNSSWNGSTFNFSATIDAKLRSMGRGLLPVSTKNGVLLSMTKDGANLPYTTETIKGVSYAVFTVTSGSYSATYGQDTTPPTVTAVSPANNATNVSTAGNIDLTFSEPLDASTVNDTNVKLLNGTTAVAAAVSYNTTSNKVTINPDASLSPNTAYTVQVATAVKDANGVALASTYTSGFTTGANTWSLWAPNTQSVSLTADNDVELGLKFTSNQAGHVNAIMFYKSPNDTQTTHTVTLWNAAGSSLGTATTANETASGWQTATFTTPVAITANTTYTASYRNTSGQYSYTAAGLGSAFTNGPLTAQANGGTYQYGGGYPNNTFNGNNYWVDVLLGE